MKDRYVFKNKGELIREYVSAGQTVLDIGFLGQGITEKDEKWPHALMRSTGADVYGVDLSIDRSRFPDERRYIEASAEDFEFPAARFDIIFAGDLIEHLPNPGKFLDACSAHLQPEGLLVLTTPNCFNLFNLAEKLSKDEPTVNADHTCYFNHKTLRVLLKKQGFEVRSIQYVYSLQYAYRESIKKKALNAMNYLIGMFTPKFNETLVVVARPARGDSTSS